MVLVESVPRDTTGAGARILASCKYVLWLHNNSFMFSIPEDFVFFHPVASNGFFAMATTVGSLR